jgi:hypothetical protein
MKVIIVLIIIYILVPLSSQFPIKVYLYEMVFAKLQTKISKSFQCIFSFIANPVDP